MLLSCYRPGGARGPRFTILSSRLIWAGSLYAVFTDAFIANSAFLTESAYVILISHKYMSTLLETLDEADLNMGWTMLIPASFDKVV